MTALLKDALCPTWYRREHTPALVHGGPLPILPMDAIPWRQQKTALRLADYVITEAGFGADLGAEKFLDISAESPVFFRTPWFWWLRCVPSNITVGFLRQNLGLKILRLLRRAFKLAAPC